MSDDKPCCAADSLRRIRQIKINGIMTGITMPDESIAEARAQNLKNEPEILAALMKKKRSAITYRKALKQNMRVPLWKNIRKPVRKTNTKKFE